MPLKLSPQDRRLLIVSGAVFLICALLAVFLSPAESTAQFATSYSGASEGAKAAYLLLLESGYHVERWTRPPAELADAPNTILILVDPLDIPGQPGKTALSRFVDNGGTLVLAGDFSPFFVSESGPTPLPVSLGWQNYTAQAPSSQALNAPGIRLDTVASWNKAAPGVPLYGDATRYTVMQYPSGRGTVLWLASSSLFSNAGLTESGWAVVEAMKMLLAKQPIKQITVKSTLVTSDNVGTFVEPSARKVTFTTIPIVSLPV